MCSNTQFAVNCNKIIRIFSKQIWTRDLKTRATQTFLKIYKLADTSPITRVPMSKLWCLQAQLQSFLKRCNLKSFEWPNFAGKKLPRYQNCFLNNFQSFTCWYLFRKQNFHIFESNQLFIQSLKVGPLNHFKQCSSSIGVD